MVALSRIPAKPLSEEAAFINTPLQPPTVKSITVETFGVDYPEPEKLPEITPEEAVVYFKRAASSVDNLMVMTRTMQ